MKKAFAVFCALVLMPGLNAQAWVGGPWGNNSPLQSGDDGIYEAVATLTNGAGLYRWAVRNNGVSTQGAGQTSGGQTGTNAASSNVLFNGGLLATQSSNIWYYRGIVYYGPAFGTVNSAIGIVSVIGNAATNTDPQTFPGASSNVNNIAIAGPAAGSDSSPNVTVIPGTPADNTTDPPTPAVPGSVVTTPAGGLAQQNIGFANSQFTAKIKQSAGRRFSGSGTISFSGVPDNVTTAVTYTTTSVPSGTVTTRTVTGTGGEESNFEQVGHKRHFKVLGSQVSTVVLP